MRDTSAEGGCGIPTEQGSPHTKDNVMPIPGNSTQREMPSSPLPLLPKFGMPESLKVSGVWVGWELWEQHPERDAFIPTAPSPQVWDA